ncbi:histidine kinase dimerization/phospho-acceptor domain-containing protein [Derxia gummosa]|uniref:histidine kinase n=1 Tax=Derxia gummosa DSM 723 TaxID=1121388 RepID=A0A8B6X2S7_9BURK|nr:PAS domain-containing protein [Derxia gummosa]
MPPHTQRKPPDEPANPPPPAALATVFTALPWPALLADSQDCIVAANPACATLAAAQGLVGAQLVGLAATPVLGRVLKRALDHARERGDISLDDFSLRDGSAFDLRLRALPGHPGHCLLLLLERARLRERIDQLEHENRELRATNLVNAKLAQVADLTNGAVIISDRQRRVIWTNRAFARITGHDGAVASGQPQAMFINGPGSDPATLADIDITLAAGLPIEHVELLAHRHDGSTYWASLSIQPVTGGDGMTERFITVLHDIGEGRATAEARHAMLYAEAVSLAKTDFLARLGHEMRAPLNAIIGTVELLRHDASLALHGTPRQLVGAVAQSARQLLGMVDQAVDLARTERSTLRLRWSEVDCVRCVRDATDLIDPELTRRDVELRIRQSLGPAVIAWADRERLEEILIHLLSNAVRDCADAGVVDVGCRVDAAAGHAVIDITHPVTESAREHVGKLIASLAPRPDAMPSGDTPRELGLSIAQWLAVMMNGRIDARRDDASLCLSLALPLPRPLARAGGERRPAADPGPLTLLCLDDNVLDIAQLEAMLEAYPSVRLHVANQREEAIELTRLLKPDVVLVADHLAGLRPAEFVRALAAARPGPAPRIALITPTARQAEAASANAASRLLVKPLTVRQLLQLLERPADRGTGG